MGQTLTHGVYLPDEGERNCYSGLAANWQLLDGSVGTIAAHTAALAGKAPLVHTHTKSDITDFPAYGTTAGTICEGNDSRLSDARTPVAHTHTKSDVTDLLNSNFIPSANNSYDLGSSSYQWNNLYAKGYYYNGTPWGLDKANVWSGDNSFTSSQLTLQNSNITRGTIPNANRNYVLSFTDSNNDNVGMIFQQVRAGSGSYKMTFSLNNGTTDHRFNFFGFTNGTSSLIPEISGVTELGSSDNKWKTFNGINPGALSLPSGGTTENTDWFNVAGAILPTGGNATSFSRATANYFTPAKDGWLALAVKNCSELSVWCETLKYGISIVAPDASLNRQVVIPVVAGKSYQILITGNSWVSARLIMPQGNV